MTILDSDKYGLLLSHFDRKVNTETRFWGSSYLGAAGKQDTLLFNLGVFSN